MTHRPMPAERQSITHRVTIRKGDPMGSLKVYITVGLYEDGTPGEVFLTAKKQGSLERGLLHCLAVMVSTMLQYGVPLSKVCEKLTGVVFEPSGPTTNRQIPWVHSVSDYLGRWLRMRFLPEAAGDGEKT